MSFQLAYPVKMTFKILALAPQIYVRDAQNRDLLYVKQKLLKLKEEVNIFSNESQTQQLYQIKADRIIDFSAKYTVRNAQGQEVGAIKRQGMASLWRSTYDIFGGGPNPDFQIKEQSVFVRFMDSLLSEVPVLGMFSGYFFNPVYLVRRAGQPDNSPPVMKMVKKPSFLEGIFYIEKTDNTLRPDEEERLIVCYLMMALLEKNRG
jgi:uncharacterized protein YxjI